MIDEPIGLLLRIFPQRIFYPVPNVHLVFVLRLLLPIDVDVLTDLDQHEHWLPERNISIEYEMDTMVDTNEF